jgi:hypothetical protein
MGQGSEDEDIASEIAELQRLRTMRWHAAEVGADDRTITVRYNADFDGDKVAPRLSHHLTADKLVLRLEMIVTITMGMVTWTAQIDGAPNHSIQIVLPEPLAGRRIVDAWEPMPLPPSAHCVITLMEEFEPVANGRRLYLDSLEMYDGSMVVKYRLRPGEQDPDEVIHMLWDLEVEDDVGTEYEVPSGGYGGHEEQITGDRDVFPSPPANARQLRVKVLDIVQGREWVERGQVTVALVDDPL